MNLKKCFRHTFIEYFIIYILKILNKHKNQIWTPKFLPPSLPLSPPSPFNLKSQLLATSFQELPPPADPTAGQTAKLPTPEITQTHLTITTTYKFQRPDHAISIPSPMVDSMLSYPSTHNWMLPWMCTPTKMAFANSLLPDSQWKKEPSKETNTAKCSLMSKWELAKDAQVTKED